MGTSIYSYGVESPAKFELSDDLARRYNEAVDQFIKAQRRFNQKFGRYWNPAKDPIRIKWSRKQRDAWNTVADIVNNHIRQHGPIDVGDYMEDYLVRNVGTLTSKSSRRFDRALTVVMGAAVLHVLFSKKH